MRFQTKIAVFILAVFLTLAGVSLIASGVGGGVFASARHGATQVSVEVSNFRILA